MSRPGHDPLFDPPPDDAGGSPAALGEPVTLPRDAGEGPGSRKRSASPLEAPLRAAVPSAVAAGASAPPETTVLYAHGPNGVSMSATWVPGVDGVPGTWRVDANEALHRLLDDALGEAEQDAQEAIVADEPGEEAGPASEGPSVEQTLASIREALARMDEKVDLARGQAVQSADAAITRFADQYLEEHHSSFADLVCPPDLLRAIRSWEEGDPLPDFDLPTPVALTEAEIARQEALRKALSAGSDSD